MEARIAQFGSLFDYFQRNEEGVCSVAFSAFEAADACLSVSSHLFFFSVKTIGRALQNTFIIA